MQHGDLILIYVIFPSALKLFEHRKMRSAKVSNLFEIK